VDAASVIYVLDNEPFTITATGGSFTPGTYPSEILPFTVGSGGALQAEPSGVIPDAATLSNPIDLMVESKSKFLYVANQGNNVIGPNPESGISAYFLTTAPAYQLSFVADQPFLSGSGPQCIVEDPSNQFIYEANQFDSTVTGRVLDPNTGDLVDMRVLSTYKLEGPATWCLVDGRTS
jgi:DNA-binding beta-propeller fold protein YncE